MAFIVYLHLAERVQRTRRDIVSASLQDIATHSGLSNSAVHGAIPHLGQQQLVDDAPYADSREPRSRVLRPWHRLSTR